MTAKGKASREKVIIVMAVWVVALLLGWGPGAPAVCAQDIYRIGPGDILDIQVWREDSVTRDGIMVRSDGYISLPLVDDVKAAGLTPMELKKRLTEAFSQFLASPRVFVVVKDPASHSVSVLGNVIKPGIYTLTKPTTVLQAVAMAGGFNEWASKDDVVIVRTLGYQDTVSDRFKINFEEQKTDKQGGSTQTKEVKEAKEAKPAGATGELGLTASQGNQAEPAAAPAKAKAAQLPLMKVARKGHEQVLFHFNYSDVISNENVHQNIMLESGDVVVVP